MSDKEQAKKYLEKLKQHINAKERDAIASIIDDIIYDEENTALKVLILNEMIVLPNHYHHQRITKELQSVGDPSTTKYIEKILENGFDYLSYTYSEDEVIAKWFSYALWYIETPEAISLIKKYAKSDNAGIRDEMQYRLRRIKEEEPELLL